MVLKASTIKATPFATFLLLVMIFVVVVFFQAAPSSQPHNNSNDTNVWNDHSQQTFARQMRELQEGHQRTLMLLNKLFCEANLVLPSGGFCLDKDKLIVGWNYYWSAKLCAALETLFGSSTVADLGAGLGHYGRCFLRNTEGILVHPNTEDIDYINKEYHNKMEEAGLNGTSQVIKSWNGWDGAANIDEFTGGKIAYVDLSSPVNLGGPFDWVMSLEVGEHIPQSGEKNFLDNLVKHACVGVVLSWAVLGQPGHGHVNCHSNDYIRKEMLSRGLVTDKVAVKLRAMVDIAHFKNTLMVFRYPKKRC